MALTVADFKERFPSLKTASDGLVMRALTAAQAEVPESVWLAFHEEGVLHRAAMKVTVDPAGIKAKKATIRNVYEVEYERLMNLVVTGPTVSAASVTDADLGI